MEHALYVHCTILTPSSPSFKARDKQLVRMIISLILRKWLCFYVLLWCFYCSWLIFRVYYCNALYNGNKGRRLITWHLGYPLEKELSLLEYQQFSVFHLKETSRLFPNRWKRLKTINRRFCLQMLPWLYFQFRVLLREWRLAGFNCRRHRKVSPLV